MIELFLVNLPHQVQSYSRIPCSSHTASVMPDLQGLLRPGFELQPSASFHFDKTRASFIVFLLAVAFSYSIITFPSFANHRIREQSYRLSSCAEIL
jgi:hypothetical protein